MRVTLKSQGSDQYNQGLANGFPLSGVISRTELTDKLKPGSMVSSFFFASICL